MLAPVATPSLSIVIPSHRRHDLLRRCLQSVTRFAPADAEILVVDDGSADSIISMTALDFPGVRVLRNSRSRGFCAAANRGIEATRGPIIELLNDDTQVSAGWAEAAQRCFDDPAVGAVAPLVFLGVPENVLPIIDSAGDGYDIGGFAWKRGHRQPLRAEFLVSRTVAGASGSSIFLRRSALAETGLFPEHFGAYFEDVDLSLRLNAAGHRIVYEPASRIWHQCGSSYGRAGRLLVEKQSCNEERLFWRNVDRAQLWRPVSRHIAVLAGKAIRRWREGHLLPFIMGRLRVMTELRLADLQR
jgi:GT2 family glycosyltransferase